MIVLKRLFFFFCSTFIFSAVSESSLLPDDKPPRNLPQGPLALKDCSGVSTSLSVQAPFVALFVEADSLFSSALVQQFNTLARSHPNLNFVVIVSFSISYNPNVCANLNVSDDVKLLIDSTDFYNHKYASELFGTAPNEIVMYTNKKTRFRYLNFRQADLTERVSRQWVATAVEELDRASAITTEHINNSRPELYLLDTFDEYPKFVLPKGGEVGRIRNASDVAKCEEHCLQYSCTAFVIVGNHECIFYAGEPIAMLAQKASYSNGSLYIRSVYMDVNIAQKIMKALLFAFIVMFAAGLFFVCASKMQRRRDVSAFDHNTDNKEVALMEAVHMDENKSGAHDEEEAAE